MFLDHLKNSISKLRRKFSLVAMGGLAIACSSPPDLLEQILLTGELRVATRNSPSTYYHGKDEPRGVDYDLAKGFAEWLGVDLRIYEAEQFRSVLRDVALGWAHVGAAGLTATEQRREIVDFGPPYQRVQPLVIYLRGTGRPRDLADLAGGRLEVIGASSFVGLLKEARKDEPGLSWVEVPDLEVAELVRRVSTGQTDFAVVDSNLYDLLKHSMPDVGAAFILGEESPVAWALQKSPDSSLRDSVEEYFSELRASGELNRILERYYFYVEPEFNYVGSRAFVKHFRSRFPEYKLFFLQAASEWGLDWRLLAAMAYQESHWSPEAVSPTGVRGMMMLTRTTAQMMGVGDRTDAMESIFGGARYIAKLLERIPERIPEPDRTWFAVAAYNVGFGHLEDARIITEIQGGDPDSWDEVRERLPLLSEPNWYERVSHGFARGLEPVRYVANIQRYYEILQWMTSGEQSSTNPKNVS